MLRARRGIRSELGRSERRVGRVNIQLPLSLSIESTLFVLVLLSSLLSSSLHLPSAPSTIPIFQLTTYKHHLVVPRAQQ